MSSGEEATDELLRQFVQDALIAKSNSGSTKLYDQLVGEVRRLKLALRGASSAPDPTSPQQLAALLFAVSRCLSIVDERKHELLLTEVLDTPLWQSPAVARRAVLEFITHLVVAHGALVQSCLHALVYGLLPPPGPAAPDPHPGLRWEPEPAEAEVQDDVVAAAQRVLELVPTSGARMLPLLVSNMPHKLRDRKTHCLYLRALFALAEARSGAGVREGVLLAVVEHLLSIDVEIRWEDIVESVAPEEAKEEVGGRVPGEEEPDIFELEGMSELEMELAAAGEATLPGGGWEGGGPEATVQEDGPGAPPPAVDETADKLDSLMELTMEHLTRRVAAGQLAEAWDTLGTAFERSVLHTHRSKFTQFLLFHMARHAPGPCCRTLLHLLLSRLTDRMQPPITRSACASYAASFLARAAFVPEPIVVDSLQRLAEWCLKYTREEDRRGGLPPIPSASVLPSLASHDANARHAAFYSACQALLYTLCYHMEPLLSRRSRQYTHTAAAAAATPTASGSAGEQQPGEATAAEERAQVLEACAQAVQGIFSEVMPKLLTHTLDPLSSCARSVVVEFGRQAGALGHPQLAAAVRDWELRRGAAGAAGAPSRPLEVFFPFDPYLLRRSAAHLDLPATYVRWRRGHPSGAPRAGLAAVEDDDSSGLEDSSDEDDESLSDGEDSSDSSDSDAESTSSGDTDDLRRTRFGSMPDSSLSSGGRRRPFGSRRMPGALKASLAALAGSGGSPTMGVPIPGGSLSTDNGSPWGMSPTFGQFGSFKPMSYTSHGGGNGTNGT